jgi:hypothetical protein
MAEASEPANASATQFQVYDTTDNYSNPYHPSPIADDETRYGETQDDKCEENSAKYDFDNPAGHQECHNHKPYSKCQ